MQTPYFRTKFSLTHHMVWALLCFGLVLWTPAMGATPISQDPKGFFGSQWGHSLENRLDLMEIDSSNTLHVYTLKNGPPQVEGIELESVKLYSLEKKYARALFHYQGEEIHKSLLQYLETQFGKIQNQNGFMMRELSQHYAWRGPETEITLTYHGFRERGFLAAESRIYAPLFLDAMSDHSY